MPDKNAKKSTSKAVKAPVKAAPPKAKAPVKPVPKVVAKPTKPAAKVPVKAVVPPKAIVAPKAVVTPKAVVAAKAVVAPKAGPKLPAAPVKATSAAKVVAPTAKAPVAVPKATTTKVAKTVIPQKPAPALKAPTPSITKDVNEKVQQLVVLSKKNGFVTVQNLNEVIPDSATDPELIENIMNILDNLEIKLLDEDEVETFLRKIDESEEEAARVVPADAPYDPFNVYLKQMGHKPLLTREQEVEISKRIEDAELRAQEFLFSCWLTLPYQLDLALKVLRKEERFDKVVIDKKVESRDAYYKMLPKATEECTKLQVRLDKGWQKYLEETDEVKRPKTREAYRKLELASKEGCKDILRKFCFKMKLFE